MEQFQKCSILKDVNTTYSGSSEKIDLSKAINVQSPDYLRGKSEGYKEGFNDAMKQFQENCGVSEVKQLVVMGNPKLHHEHFKELWDKSTGIVVMPDDPIIPLTEEDKTRDREQIKEYVKDGPKYRQCGKTGINENHMNNLLKKYGRNG